VGRTGLVVGCWLQEHGRTPDDALAELSRKWSTVDRDYWQRHALCPAIAEIASGSFKQKEPPAIVGSGFVVRSLEAALWAFHHSDSFHEGALRAVNLGNDADTTGAIYGQLAGAFYGVHGIPQAWLEPLAMRKLINEMASALYDHRPHSD
jgi:ADP-ribosyl-[dinitrogen reductase] hydrolase